MIVKFLSTRAGLSNRHHSQDCGVHVHSNLKFNLSPTHCDGTTSAELVNSLVQTQLAEWAISSARSLDVENNAIDTRDTAFLKPFDVPFLLSSQNPLRLGSELT